MARKPRPDDAYPEELRLRLAAKNGSEAITSDEGAVWRVVAVSEGGSYRFVNSVGEIDNFGSLDSKADAMRLWKEMQLPIYGDLNEKYYVRKFRRTAVEVVE